ncbi:MAG: hypothetical protein R3D45_11840 [Rhizobiaceae bacterium]
MALLALTAPSSADFVINDDLIVDGSACIGFDCVNGESFGFDTIRLKENNLRIKFDDTSVAASFPRNDWQITVNDSANGGLSKFSIDDISGARTPFTIEAGARSHSLYVDDGGRIGIRTNTPSVELHIVDGDTPTLRLQQDGSSGFAPQTWDVAGNETNFFIRDVTNGSQLPLRIRPDAPTNSIFIDVDGDVGMGTASPDDALDIEGTDSVAIRLTSTAATAPNPIRLNHNANTNEFRITWDGLGVNQFRLTSAGDLTLSGGLITTGGGGACTVADPCDAVFDPSVYKVPSIDEHAEEMWAKGYLPAIGPTKPDEPLNVTLKLTRMLNELEKAHIYIEQLHRRLEGAEKLELAIAELRAELDSLKVARR